jgi:hypothetical protein
MNFLSFRPRFSGNEIVHNLRADRVLETVTPAYRIYWGAESVFGFVLLM